MAGVSHNPASFLTTNVVNETLTRHNGFMSNINIFHIRFVDQPVPFAGTDEERAVNFASHHFDPEEGRCWDCDCRPWGYSADYPCGAEVPREVKKVVTR